jgi:hypothetical protein
VEYISKPGKYGPVAGKIKKNRVKEAKYGKEKIPDQIGMP